MNYLLHNLFAMNHKMAKAINYQYAKVYKKKLFPTTLSKIKDLIHFLLFYTQRYVEIVRCD